MSSAGYRHGRLGIGRIGRKLQRGVDETQNRTELIVRCAEFGETVGCFPPLFGNDRFDERLLAIEIWRRLPERLPTAAQICAVVVW
ncbi:hypothetical protein ACQZ5K_06935 [Agrobacterium sp. 22-226-1]